LLKPDKERLRQLGNNTHQYKPGISLVRINLLSYWGLNYNRNVVEVREQAKIRGEFLAHSEILSTYGLHNELLKKMDGKSLPYVDLAGYEFKTYAKDSEFKVAICLNQLALSRVPSLYANLATNRTKNRAAPIILAQ